MRIGTLIALSFMGMVASSLAVWTLTASSRFRQVPRAIPEPSSSQQTSRPAPSSVFRVGDSIATEGRLGHPILGAGHGGETYLYVELAADAKKSARTLAQLNLSILIDRSGSMRGKKLDNAVAAARGAVRRLRDGDVVTVLSYNTAAEVISPVMRVDASARERIGTALGSLTASGNTCISCAIDSAKTLLGQNRGMVNRILLLSDGEATAGVLTVEGFRSIAAECRNAGISITAIGVDVQYNERVMAELAIESNGRHYFVEDADGLPRIFDQELAALTRTIASDAELVVTAAPGFTVAEIYDRRYRQDGNGVAVPLGTFAAGEQKTLLARIKVPPSAEGTHSAAEVELRYRDLSEGKARYDHGTLALSFSTDPTRVSALDPVVLLRLSRSQARSTLFEANELFRNGRVAEARQVLGQRRDELKSVSKGAAAAAPAARRSEVEADFQRQDRALEQAQEGLRPAPPGAPAAAPAGAPAGANAKRAPAQVRANADYAVQAGY